MDEILIRLRANNALEKNMWIPLEKSLPLFFGWTEWVWTCCGYSITSKLLPDDSLQTGALHVTSFFHPHIWLNSMM